MKSHKSYAIFVTVIIGAAAMSAYSTQRFVPSQYATIQTAVDHAFDGDEIIASPGTYTGETFVDKSLIIRSTDPNDPAIVDSTIIDGLSATGCFDFSNGSTAKQFELSGFTIQNSLRSTYGGVYLSSGTLNIKNCCFSFHRDYAVYSGSSSVLNITGCKFIGNTTSVSASSVVYSKGWLTVNRCLFLRNYKTPLSFSNSYTYIYNSVFALNIATENASAIYGIYGRAKIYNCTIADNTGYAACNMYYYSGWTATNCIFYRNSPANFLSLPPSYAVTYSNVQGGCAGVGNFDADPMFVDPNNPAIYLRDYHLRSGSPCINTGDPNNGPDPDPYNLHEWSGLDIDSWSELDIDGQPRISPYTRIDVGADEVPSPAIKLVSPIGSEIWAAGSEHKIKWQGFNISQLLNISFSADAGLNWELIADNVSAAAGEYLWLLPDANSTQCLIKIEPVVPGSNTSYSNFGGIFTIHPDALGDDVEPLWPTENKDFRHTSNSDTSGPMLGCTKWQFMTDSALAGSPVIGKNGNIHLLCISGKLYTIDASGNQLWIFDANSTVLSSPAVGKDGSIYFGSEAGRLFAISPEGSIRWNFDTLAFGAYTPAISANNKIYFGCADGTLYCLAADGSEIWHYNIPPNGYWIAPVVAPPAIGPDGAVYFGGLSTVLYAADADTGQIKWMKNFGSHYDPMDTNSIYLGGSMFSSAVIADDGTVYISPIYDSNLYALNPADGSIIWQTLLAAPTSGQTNPRYQNPTVWSTPALGPDGTIYASCDDPNLRAINPDGSVKWGTRLGMIGAFTLATGSDGLIYAASDDGRLYVVDSNGLEVARFEGQSWLSFPAITGNNELIVADANNIIYCLSSVCDNNTQSLHRPADLSRDLQVNFNDFALFAESWLGCTDSYPPCQKPAYQYPPPTPLYPTGDFDNNCRVDYRDLAVIIANWLCADCNSGNNYCNSADINKSGKIDNVDFAFFVSHWLETCTYTYIFSDPMYLQGDINLDGYVDFEDVIILSLEWLEY